MKTKKIYIAGHRGLVGSAICEELTNMGCTNILTMDRRIFDLKDTYTVRSFFRENRPQIVILAAAKVGGIIANSQCPVSFLLDNLKIQNNVIEACADYGVEKLLFLGSSCIYPKLAKQPITEDQLLAGHLEPTNDAYAIAKIAGIRLCRAYNQQFGKQFLCAMPTNLYGPRDQFDVVLGHVIPALIRKIHAAKIKCSEFVPLIGSGNALREFLHVSDLAKACITLLSRMDAPDLVNIGSGEEISIRELAEMLKGIIGYQGEFRFHPGELEGTPRKLLDSSKIRSMGWRPKISLYDGLKMTYDWFLEHHAE
jgi:GDP-L-fucose synthase